MPESALDRVLRLSGSPLRATLDTPVDADLLLSAQVGLRELAVTLAQADDDGDDDEGDDGDQGGGSHADHATYKALVKKNVPAKRAAAMCAKADNKVKASALCDSLQVIVAGLAEPQVQIALAAGDVSTAERKKGAEEGWALSDGSYPIKDVKHLHSAATLAASGHGDVPAAKKLIRKRARELGVDVTTLPGFGGASKKDETLAATMVLQLAANSMHATAAVAHPPFHGVHAHSHVHSGDNIHGAAGPDRTPGQHAGW